MSDQLSPATARTGFHVMTKPIGPICNLDCKYCFYLEKEKMYPEEGSWKMTVDVLEAYVRQYIESQDTPVINFAWQGGEPTLLGVDYFRHVIEVQKKYAGGKTISNALQTNGTLLDDEWGKFLSDHQFLVGLSIDGPRELHDRYRVDKQQKPTFDAVMRGINVLKRNRTEFNTLTVVNRVNGRRPVEVYEFLKEIGSGFMQFIPLVERLPQNRLKVLGFDFAEPPVEGDWSDPESPVTSWSVDAHDYGNFLVQIFDRWVRRDVGQVFVQLFDVALGIWAGQGSSLCVFSEKCGKALAVEHNGDLYSCDHYVYPRYKLGNVLNHSLGELVHSMEQKKFGDDKADTLPSYCRSCEVRFACNGECPKHRFTKTPDGEDGLNYLCPAYKRFFRHIDPHMKTMVELLQIRQPPARIMELLARREQPGPTSVNRNDPCPCSSGKKFKKCCGADKKDTLL
jgi:uncharacterized protein